MFEENYVCFFVFYSISSNIKMSNFLLLNRNFLLTDYRLYKALN